MKNKFAMAIGGMIAATILGLGFSQSGTVQAGPILSQEDIRSQLEKQYPGEITELELDKEAKNPIYEVEIDIEGKEYELAMDGNTGEVLHLSEKPELQKLNNTKEENVVTEKDASKQGAGELTFIEKPITNPTTEEIDNKDDSNQGDSTKDEKASERTSKNIVDEVELENTSDDKGSNKGPEELSPNRQTTKVETEVKSTQSAKEENNDSKVEAKSVKPTQKAVIGGSKAKSIALAQFAGNVVELELDQDDGRFIYEIEIENGNNEAEIEIDAYTGEVLVIEVDTEDDDD